MRASGLRVFAEVCDIKSIAVDQAISSAQPKHKS
jgi:hypothetical protein